MSSTPPHFSWVEAPTAMPDGKNADRLRLDFVDHSVLAMDDFADRRPTDLRNHPTLARKARQLVDGVENALR